MAATCFGYKIAVIRPYIRSVNGTLFYTSDIHSLMMATF